MPRDLASDPDRTVFDYRGIISPPRDLGRAGATSSRRSSAISSIATAATRSPRWLFEVWNEPNLQVFWTGTEGDYFDLYDASARAVKAVDPAFEVGGPSTSAAGLGRRPAGARPKPRSSRSTSCPPTPTGLRRSICARSWPGPAGRTCRSGGPNGASARRHGAPVNDSVWGAPLVARGMRSAAGRLHALAYWVASDHFVELGAPQRLFHGGFGLLTVGNLRKPRFWAIGSSSGSAATRSRASRGRRRGQPRRGVGIARRRRDRDRASGTARSTRARRTVTPAWTATSRCRSVASSPGRTCSATGASMPTIRTSTGCGRSSVTTTGPTTSAGSG